MSVGVIAHHSNRHGVHFDDGTNKDFDVEPKPLRVTDFRRLEKPNECGRMSVRVMNQDRIITACLWTM